MPFDSLAMAAVADELRDTLLSGRIQKIIQPSESSVAFSVYAHGQGRWLVASADARRARVHLVAGKLAKAFPTPSSFIMLLRKHLEGAHITTVEQMASERVLQITVSSNQSLVKLIVEAMGKHSNVILVSESRILGALKIVPPHLSRVRPIMVGHEYVPPPPQRRDERLYPPGPRLVPPQDIDQLFRLLSDVPPETEVRSALQGILAGVSPFLSEQIALRGGTTGTSPLGAVPLQALTAAATELYQPLTSRTWYASTFIDQRGRCDFAPYRPLGMNNVQSIGSMSEAIEYCLGQSEERDSLSSSRNALLEQIVRSQRTEQRKLGSLLDGLKAAEGAETLMLQGQMLLAYQHQVKPRATVLDLPELEMSIPLDPAKSAASNAERYFRRYRKLRDARARLPGLIAQTEARLAELEDTATFVRLASSEADLSALRRESKQDESAVREARGKPKSPARGPLRFLHGEDLALVGRSARQNDELTFRLAGRNDIWLHARQRTGAHVILQQNSQPATDEAITRAAALAAYYSEGRTDTAVDVDVTQVRHVRKISGSAPGRVTYSHFRTFRVTPDASSWNRQSSG
ncbi:MAG TPA: NFACT family protein [Chloroflexota bacterium]